MILMPIPGSTANFITLPVGRSAPRTLAVSMDLISSEPVDSTLNLMWASQRERTRVSTLSSKAWEWAVQIIVLPWSHSDLHWPKKLRICSSVAFVMKVLNESSTTTLYSGQLLTWEVRVANASSAFMLLVATVNLEDSHEIQQEIVDQVHPQALHLAEETPHGILRGVNDSFLARHGRTPQQVLRKRTLAGSRLAVY